SGAVPELQKFDMNGVLVWRRAWSATCFSDMRGTAGIAFHDGQIALSVPGRPCSTSIFFDRGEIVAIYDEDGNVQRYLTYFATGTGGIDYGQVAFDAAGNLVVQGEI